MMFASTKGNMAFLFGFFYKFCSWWVEMVMTEVLTSQQDVRFASYVVQWSDEENLTLLLLIRCKHWKTLVTVWQFYTDSLPSNCLHTLVDYYSGPSYSLIQNPWIWPTSGGPLWHNWKLLLVVSGTCSETWGSCMQPLQVSECLWTKPEGVSGGPHSWIPSSVGFGIGGGARTWIVRFNLYFVNCHYRC